MTKIKVLPEILANKIAAGEIIERPASVVKELLENSLDAGATQITVEIAHGGRRLIRIRDDGEGMSHDDALLAFEHHATSKLKSAEDLFSIATLGFRGEALPSIASVSRLTLRTIDSQGAHTDNPVGTEVVISGGTIRSVKGIPWPAGTEVTVQDLFFNVPARKKFLKSNPTELSHMVRLVTQYAVAFQNVAVKFIHDGRTLLECEAGVRLEERLQQVLGRQVVDNLVRFEASGDGHRVHGFASRPHEQRSNPYSQYLFVNRRLVKDRFIQHAIRLAYGPALPQGAYPILVIFVQAPPEEIDVNVHPAKTEVRFRNQELVHRLVRESVEKALLQARPIPRFSVPKEEISKSEGLISRISRPENAPNTPTLLVQRPPQDHRSSSFPQGSGALGSASGAIISADINTVLSNTHNILDNITSSNTLGCGKLKLCEDEELLPKDSTASLSDPISALRPIGHLSNTYILAADTQGLVIIDQHVAHERILFEKYLAELKSQLRHAQRLLVPITFDLTPDQVVRMEKIKGIFEDNGFEIEDFGGRTFSIKAVPAILDEPDYRELIIEIMEEFEDQGASAGLDRFQRILAASLACRAAVKAHSHLTGDKILWIIDKLSLVKYPHACPHGRPILLRLTFHEIEKRFLRI